ncbi:OprO/OprP family phosphate-selective porin [Microbulbifer sp. JMSA008]|uniref:OprO/OprP family phosphate-selective porin n=1 Tax=Microbulbifer sp. JMSA008 TaxID=3243373 RepID=UPI00403958FA
MKYYALYFALTCVLLSPFATADKAKTEGGLKITSKDENFSAELGGRIHFDTYFFDKDKNYYDTILFDTELEEPVNTTDFRRVRLKMRGKLWKWEYELERDFASSGAGGLRTVYLGTKVFDGSLRIGNFKPSRSMNQLTSSNQITMMERSFASSAGIYDNRGRQQGIGWHTHWCCHTYGVTLFNLRNPGDPRNEGIGAATRFTWAPISNFDSTVHLGASFSYEDANEDTPPREALVEYAGRRGPEQLVALSPGGGEFFFGDFGDDEFYQGDPGGDVWILGLELAGAYGPFYAQSEYAFGNFSGDFYLSEFTFFEFFGAPPRFFCDPYTGCFIGDQDVRTWYIVGSWAITGQHKPYDEKSGVFRSIKPTPPESAFEITARYDTIENRDIPGMKVSNFVFGFNYYFNPKVRLMLNVTLGDDKFTGDQTKQLAIRMQGFW